MGGLIIIIPVAGIAEKDRLDILIWEIRRRGIDGAGVGGENPRLPML